MSKPERRVRRKLASCLAISLISASISGCETSPLVINTACTSFKPIFPSVHDVLTNGTKAQIINHNEEWERECVHG